MCKWLEHNCIRKFCIDKHTSRYSVRPITREIQRKAMSWCPWRPLARLMLTGCASEDVIWSVMMGQAKECDDHGSSKTTHSHSFNRSKNIFSCKNLCISLLWNINYKHKPKATEMPITWWMNTQMLQCITTECYSETKG